MTSKSSVMLPAAVHLSFPKRRSGLRSVLSRLHATIDGIDSYRIAGTPIVGGRKTVASTLTLTGICVRGGT